MYTLDGRQRNSQETKAFRARRMCGAITLPCFSKRRGSYAISPWALGTSREALIAEWNEMALAIYANEGKAEKDSARAACGG